MQVVHNHKTKKFINNSLTSTQVKKKEFLKIITDDHSDYF